MSMYMNVGISMGMGMVMGMGNGYEYGNEHGHAPSNSWRRARGGVPLSADQGMAHSKLK